MIAVSVRDWICGVFLVICPAAALSTASTYVGVAVCAKCHDTSHWSQSRHSKMVQPATRQGVLGDFSRSRIQLRGKWYRLERSGDAFFIIETYLKAKPQRHRIEYTLGNRRM